MIRAFCAVVLVISGLSVDDGTENNVLLQSSKLLAHELAKNTATMTSLTGLQRTTIGASSALSRLHRVAHNTTHLLHAAQAIGLPWNLQDAEEHGRHLRATHSMLESHALKSSSVASSSTASSSDASDNLGVFCVGFFAVGGSNSSCGGEASTAVSYAAPNFLSSSDTDWIGAVYSAASITTAVVELVDQGNPALGLVTSLLGSTIMGTLFPSDSTAAQLTNMYNFIMQEVGNMIDTTFMRSALADQQMELLEIARQLEWVPGMLKAGSNDKTALLSFNIHMQHELSVIGTKIRDGTFSSVGSTDEWAYTVFPIAVQLMMTQINVLLAIADTDASYKPHIARQIRSMMLTDTNPPSWKSWYQTQYPVVTAAITSEFGAMDWSYSISARGEYGIGGQRRRNWKCRYTGRGSNMSLFWGGMYPAVVLNCSVYNTLEWDVDTGVQFPEGSYRRRRDIDCTPYRDQLFAESNGCKDKSVADPLKAKVSAQFAEWARWFDDHIAMAEDLSEYVCPSGYNGSVYNLEGTGKTFTRDGRRRVSKISDCQDVCEERSGCTGFEYTNDEGGSPKCATYTGGNSNIRSEKQTRGWASCVKSR